MEHTVKLDVANPQGQSASSDDFPVRLRRGDSFTIACGNLRLDDDATPAVFAAGDVLTFTLRQHPAEVGWCDERCLIFQLAGTFTIGQRTALFAVTPGDWGTLSRFMFLTERDCPADIQLVRSDGSTYTLWAQRVVVEPDVT